MRQINATLVNLYHVCKRELWLHANEIRFEHTSDTVYEGKMIHETSYSQRSERYEEVDIEGCKIDYYDPHNRVIHEIKKSNKVEKAHIWQLKYYIYILQKNGIEQVRGILEYPTMRKREEVMLESGDIEKIKAIINDIKQIINSENCPTTLGKPICNRCSYFDFCYSGEEL